MAEQVEEQGSMQDQILEMVQKSQEAILDASRRFTDTASDLVPGNLEQMNKLIDSAFELTEKVMKAQRDFAKQALDALTPGGQGTAAKA